MDMKKIEDSVENALIFENQKNNLIDESVISNNINGLTAMDAVSKIDLSGYKSAMDAVSKIDLSGYKSAMDAVSKISSNWVLTDSVVNAMSLENKEKETKYIFGKIPKDTYQLCQSFNDDSEKLEYILENKENTESIPVREIPRVLAITDIVTSLSTKDVFSLYR
ncbi:RES domain-containing protein, partial [Bacillus thuringiensis]|nr:RES domain-containing protein [Bacillus thuringiensis]